LYHHCLAGVDYAEQCPHQLVWNDHKKMCDWQTVVNCTGKIIPVATGETSFCTDKPDNKYADLLYCVSCPLPTLLSKEHMFIRRT
jgi:hypothetical protein